MLLLDSWSVGVDDGCSVWIQSLNDLPVFVSVCPNLGYTCEFSHLVFSTIFKTENIHAQSGNDLDSLNFQTLIDEW